MTKDPTAVDASNAQYEDEDNGPQLSLVDLLTWLGDGKWLIAAVTIAAAVLSLIVSLLMTPIYTAKTSLLPPGSQQQSSSAAALAALGSLGGLGVGLASKSPDELYLSLLKSDSVASALDSRFGLRTRYQVKTYEALRKALPQYVRVASEKKSGVINVEVDDADAKFAADLANAHVDEVMKLLGRLAVSEAQQRRVFFEKQLKDTKENLVKAETDLQRMQETSGVIVLDKQADAIISGAAQLRSRIAEREVQLKVMRTGATDQNPEVIRLNSELRALRSELARQESNQGGNPGSSVDIPVGKIPQATIDYVRAQREFKLQESLLESMVRQFEMAKLDEAKEGPLLQQIDVARPPDYKSKPSRALVVLAGTTLALLGSMFWVLFSRYSRRARENWSEDDAAWDQMKRAWQLRPVGRSASESGLLS